MGAYLHDGSSNMDSLRDCRQKALLFRASLFHSASIFLFLPLWEISPSCSRCSLHSCLACHGLPNVCHPGDEGRERTNGRRSSECLLLAKHPDKNVLDRCQEAKQRQKKPHVWENSAKQDLPDFLCGTAMPREQGEGIRAGPTLGAAQFEHSFPPEQHQHHLRFPAGFSSPFSTLHPIFI